MKVSEVITLLKDSELKQLKIKDDDNAILGFINLAILEIHKRFLLWEAEAIVTIVDGTLIYNLRPGDPNVSIDLTDNNLLMIEKIYLAPSDNNNYLYDHEMVINNEKDPQSLYTPKPSQIKIITPEKDKTLYLNGDTLNVTYRASPLFLTNDTEEIPLALQFLEALQIYVAYKGHNSIKSGVKDENNTHYVRFNAACKTINTNGLISKKDLESTKFEQRGFV